VLSPADIVGPGYELLPGFIGGGYSWPGEVEGITLVPEGFTPGGVGAALSASLLVTGTQAVASTLTPDVAGTAALTPSGTASLPLPAVTAGSLPLVPA